MAIAISLPTCQHTSAEVVRTGYDVLTFLQECGIADFTSPGK